MSMDESNKYRNKKVAILGLGIEGMDAVKYLLDKEAAITLYDKKAEEDLDFDGIDKTRIKIISGGNYLRGGLDGFDYIVRSPGVYRFLPEITDAEKKGVIVTSPIRMFFDDCSARTIGVTGTKGKGTTSTLIYQILKSAGNDVYLVGNIGRPYLELLSKLETKSIVVMELSSFQLIDLNKSPNIAVVLNITVDHLDWHKNIQEYIESKTNIVSHQKENDIAVINYDYDIPRKFAKDTKAEVLYFSKDTEVVGSYIQKSEIFLNIGKGKIEIGRTNDLLLKGRHNWENIMPAICVGAVCGVPSKIIKEAVFNFKGLEHRLELVTEVSGRTFYNDSFATGPQPTIAAVKSFIEPETLILGGSDKGLSFDELGKVVAGAGNVKNIFLIGQIGKKIGEALNKAGYKGIMEDLGQPDMDLLVKKAFEATPRGGVIILSPAAASFDMFKNYKDRGKKYKAAVLKLKNEQ